MKFMGAILVVYVVFLLHGTCGKIIEIKKETDFNKQLKSKKLVVAIFTTTSLGPSNSIVPDLEQITKDYSSSVVFVEANIDERVELSKRFDIEVDNSLKILFIKNGKEIYRLNGKMTLLRHYIDEQNRFDKNVKNAAKKLVIIFYYDKKSKILESHVDEFAKEHADKYVVVKAHRSYNVYLARRFEVSDFPTFVILKGDSLERMGEYVGRKTVDLIHNIDKLKEFENKFEKGKWVAVYFYSSMCPFCIAFMTNVREITAKQFEVIEVDYERVRSLSIRFGIATTPTTVFTKIGQHDVYYQGSDANQLKEIVAQKLNA